MCIFRLFATLDPTLRRVHLPSGREAILSDTVGFISDLPHQLVNAFKVGLPYCMCLQTSAKMHEYAGVCMPFALPAKCKVDLAS